MGNLSRHTQREDAERWPCGEKSRVDRYNYKPKGAKDCQPLLKVKKK